MVKRYYYFTSSLENISVMSFTAVKRRYDLSMLKLITVFSLLNPYLNVRPTLRAKLEKASRYALNPAND